MLQDEPRGPHDSRPVHPRGPGESRQRQGSHAPQRPHHPRRPARAGGPSEKLNRGQVAQILTIVRPVLVQPHHPSGPGRKRMHARCASRSLQRSGWAYRRASAQAAPFRLRDRLLLPEEVGLGRQFAIHGISGFSHWAHRFIAGWSQYFFFRRPEVESQRGRARKWLWCLSTSDAIFLALSSFFLPMSTSCCSLILALKLLSAFFTLSVTPEAFVCGP